MACHFAKLACHLPTSEPISAKPHSPISLSNPNGDDSGFVVQELTVEERKKLHSIDFSFLKQAGHAPLRCEVSDNHVPYPAPYIFSLPACPLSSANTFLPYFSVISAFHFLNHFPVLLKGIKIAVMNIPLIFTNKNAITAITFFCYSVFVKLFLAVNLFSCYCYFVLSQISKRSCNKFSSFIRLRC